MTTDDKLRELGKALPWERPDDARREALRSSLLVAAEAELPVAPRSRRVTSGVAFAAGVLAAAAVAVVVVRRDGPPAPAIAHAQITASPAAELEHSVTSTAHGTDEIIRVHAGTVAIDAPGARPRDRVRVVTRDAEVEGTGTYDVTVAHDALTAVAMRSGTATVRVLSHEQPVFLSAGEVWHAEVVTAELVVPGPGSGAAPAPPASAALPAPTVAPSVPTPAPPAPSMASATPRTPRTSAPPPPRPSAAPAPTVPAWHPTTLAPQADPAPRPAVTELAISRLEPVAPASAPHRPSAIERHFQAGSTLLRANKLREAAVELAAAADASDVDPLALDARYLQATALVGAGQSAEAERALVAFLDHAPRSIRRGRAQVLLARLIATRGDVPSARAWFSAALDDADPDVATAARAGLAALPH
jgi:Tetratricopeptide repeat